MNHCSIEQALDAGLNWVVWRSDDELASLSELETLATRKALRLKTWSLERDTKAYDLFDQGLDLALERGPNSPKEIWVWLDYAPPRSLAPTLERKLRRLAQTQRNIQCVFIQYYPPSSPCPPERHELMRQSPSRAQLTEQIAARAIDRDFGLPPDQGDRIYELRTRIAQHCIGLSSWQLDLALRMGAPIQDADACMAAILQYKAQALNQAKLVQACDSKPTKALGGLSAYKAWLEMQKHALTPQAREAGIPSPKGALLVGVPGCGKSLAARVTAHLLELPLYRLDVGSLFTGILGGSEARMRDTLALCERLAPCVLWIDEIEKGFGQSAGHTDGGAAKRSLATLITWLQEKESPVFLIATANRIHALPPELTRKGRLDETFFVDLPDADDRQAVLQVYGVASWTPAPETMAKVLDASEGFSGSELQACVAQARLQAHIAARPVQWSDLLEVIHNEVPLSKARAAEIQALQSWGQINAKPAQRTA